METFEELLTAQSTIRPCAGDVVLLNGGAKLSALNRAYQRTVRPGATVYSHVALNYSVWTLIHAVPVGVDVICHSDVFGSGAYEDDWRVMRHPEVARRIAEDPNYEEVIRQHAAYFFQQRYNFLVNVKVGRRPAVDSRSFCSELVAKVYDRLGFPLGVRPETILPADVATLCTEGNWNDVSQAYRREPLGADFRELFMKSITPELIAESGLSAETLVERFFDDSLERRDTELTRQRLTLFRSSTRNIVNSHRMVNAVKGALRRMGIENTDTQPTELPKLPNTFWDSGKIGKKPKR